MIRGKLYNGYLSWRYSPDLGIPRANHQMLRECAKNQDHRIMCWHAPLCPSSPAPAPAAHPEQCARRLLETSKEEIAQPLWAACPSAPSAAQHRSAAFRGASEATSYAPVCAHCLLSRLWALLKTEQLCLHYILPSVICMCCWELPWGFILLALAATAPHRKDTPIPSSSLWPSIGFFPACPCLTCTTLMELDSVLQVWRRHWWAEGKDHFSWPAVDALPSAA